MKHILVFIICCWAIGSAQAQKNSIVGAVLDSAGAPLPAATVMLLSVEDSSLLNFAASNPSGGFEIRNVKPNRYLFKISFVGYLSHLQEINYTNGLLDLGRITLQEDRRQLSEVLVEAERVPVSFNKDTLQFHAESFKVNPNATVEDLLKKLPGVEVDKDGTIRAQGEEVQRVTVDGKEFFGRDPKLATRNLPADAINKVQMYNRKSDMAEFTGIDDGSREKTINLQLKEDKKKMTFGNALAGGGTDDRYQGKLSLNRFNKSQQISLLGMANNINEAGFSPQEYLSFLGGMQRNQGGMVRIEINSDNASGIPLNIGGQTSGIMSTYGGGLNFNQTLGKKTDLTSSYFFSQLDHDVERLTDRFNALPNGNYHYDQRTQQNSNSLSHRINTVLDHRLDSANSLKLTTNFSLTGSELLSQSNSLNELENGTKINDANSRNYSESEGYNLTSTLLYRHKFAKKGRTFSSSFDLGLSDTDRDGRLNSTNNFYGNNARTEVLDQVNRQFSEYQSYAGTFSYTEPLGGRKYLEANYQIRQNNNQVNREVFDSENGTLQFNEALSNRYNSVYTYQRGGLNFRLNRKKYNAMAGVSYQRTDLFGDLILQEVDINQTFSNFLPRANFNYEFSNTRRFSLEYETSMQEPTIQQLQPVVDNTDPLNISVGNPDLQPAFNNLTRLSYTAFDPVNMRSFFAFLTVNYLQDAITNGQSVDANLVRTTRPENVDYNLNVTSNVSVGFPIKPLNARLSVGSQNTYQRGINLINNLASTLEQRQWGGNLRYDYTLKEFFDFSLAARLSHQTNSYSFSEQSDQRFLNSQYTAETNLTFLKNYRFSASAEYYTFQNLTNDSREEIPLVNLSISRYLLKNQAGELKLSVQNLLDRDQWVSQQADINYFQRQTTNLLGRYVMLSFNYAINKHFNPMGGMGRRGARMMMIR